MAMENTQAETRTIVCPSCTAGKVELWGSAGHPIGYALCSVCEGYGRVSAPLASDLAVSLYNATLDRFPAYVDDALQRVNAAADRIREVAPQVEALIGALENAALSAMNDSFDAGVKWGVAAFPVVVSEYVANDGEPELTA